MVGHAAVEVMQMAATDPAMAERIVPDLVVTAKGVADPPDAV